MTDLIVPGNHDDLMWGLDLSGTRKNWAWWWWWWLFLFKDKGKKKPRQLMVLWSGKTADRVKVRDYNWKKRYDPRVKGSKAKFHGLVCSWYFDGKSMHDPLFIVDTPVSVWHNKKGGGITGMVDKDYSFYGKPDQYTVALRNEEIDATFRLSPVSRELSSPRHGVTKKPLGMSYEIYKHLCYKFEGEMMEGAAFKPIQGTAYFQKVKVNAPAIPWYWGVFHTENGYYFDYMMPHIGPSMLKTDKPHSKGPDKFPYFMNPSMEFFDPTQNKWHQLGDVRISRTYRKNLPVFKLSGTSGRASLEFTAETYSRAHWRFQQNDNRSRIFYYNEYPARVTDFTFKDGKNLIGSKDIGKTFGNVEHTWGRLY